MKARVATVIAALALAIGGVAWWASSDDDPGDSVATDTRAADELSASGAEAETGEQATTVPTEPPGFSDFPGQPYVVPWGEGFLELVFRPGTDTKVTAAVSDDGTTWESVDVVLPELPEGHVSATAVIGERLVMSYGTWSPDGQPSAPILLESEDLTTWRQVDLPTEQPADDLPDFVITQSQIDRVAATTDGWVAVQSTFTFVEPERLLPIDRADFEQGYGVGITAEGIEFDPQDGEQRLFTWEELGVDPDVGAALPQHEQQVTLWHARWGEDPQPIELDGAHWVAALASNGSDYLAYVHRGGGGELLRSSDGATWEPASAAPLGEISTLAPIDGGWLAQVWRMSGTAIVVSTDDGATWQTAVTEGLPDSDQLQLEVHTQASAASNGLATVAFAHNLPPFATDSPAVTYEHDGFEVTVQDGQFESSITIVELTTGDVVLDETYSPPTNEEIRALEEAGDTEALDALRDTGPPWRSHGETTSDFVDPETGDLIVSVPWEVEAAAFEGAYRDLDNTFEDPGPPDMWLLATQDGSEWLSVLLTDEERPFIGLGAAAINGDTVVVSTGAEREVYTVGG